MYRQHLELLHKRRNHVSHSWGGLLVLVGVLEQQFCE